MLEYVRYRVPQTEGRDFEAAYRRAESALRRAPGCRDVELSRGLEDPERYVLRIRWTGEPDERAFRSSVDCEDFSAALDPYAR